MACALIADRRISKPAALISSVRIIRLQAGFRYREAKTSMGNARSAGTTSLGKLYTRKGKVRMAAATATPPSKVFRNARLSIGGILA